MPASRTLGPVEQTLFNRVKVHREGTRRLPKDIGWHTFRRTFSTLLRANSEDVKVVQELVRHATVKMTLEVYAQAVTLATREAQSKVAGLLNADVCLLDP